MSRKVDLQKYIGKTFEKLTVVSSIIPDNSKRLHLVATCECGTEGVLVLPYQLSKGKKSCGCAKKNPALLDEKFNLVGQVFGNLTVISRHEESRQHKYTKKRQWVCLCACGNIHISVSHNLKNGDTKSCGCLNHVKGRRSKGEFRTKVYAAWKNAIFRCSDESYLSTERYKGRGIVMSEEFKNNFETFYDYIGDPPSEDFTLERLDVNGNYERGNLTWVLPKFQARNRGMLDSNTSGVTGVMWQNDKVRLAAVAYWKEFDELSGKNKSRSRSFSVSKYGEELAFELAVTARNEAIDRLNAMGYGYTENHGK